MIWLIKHRYHHQRKLCYDKTIIHKGWSGSGYSIVDKRMGTGAYLISGGANGAIILAIIGAILLLVALTIFTGGFALPTTVLFWMFADFFAIFAGLQTFLGVISLVLGGTLYTTALAKLVITDGVKPDCFKGIGTAGFVMASLMNPWRTFQLASARKFAYIYGVGVFMYTIVQDLYGGDLPC